MSHSKTSLHKSAWFRKGDRFKHKSAPGVYVVTAVKHLPPEGNVGYEMLTDDPDAITPTLMRFQRELMRDFMLLPGDTESTPYFFTGKTGEDHWKAAEHGKDYVAINLRTGWVVHEDDMADPTHAKRLLDQCEWGSWVRIRCFSADEALKLADDCEDQFECFQNEDEDYLNIVNTPIADREF